MNLVIMSKLSSSVACSLVCLVAVAALPTDFPILRPRPGAGLGAPPNSDEATTEDLEAIVVEAAAATTTIDGILVVENNENGGGSSVVKEFDPSDCFLMKERGPCRAAIDSWFFNVGTKSCENFSWSGCGGNKNRFPDQSTCENLCSRPDQASGKFASSMEATASDSASSTTSPSSESPSSTTTTTAKPRLPVCPKFDGCSSNCVIIQDRSDRGCKKCLCGPARTAVGDSKSQIPPNIQVSTGNITVGSTSAAPEPVGSVSGDPSATSEEDVPIIGTPAEVCQLPAKRGHCRAMQTRYRYDSKVKDCVQFHYGGCDANPNNFVSKDKCVEYCKGQ